MRAVIGQHRMDRIGHGLDEGAEEVTGDASRGFLVQFDEGEFGDPVDGNQQIELALCGLDFGDVDVEVAKWVSFELAFGPASCSNRHYGCVRGGEIAVYDPDRRYFRRGRQWPSCMWSVHYATSEQNWRG